MSSRLLFPIVVVIALAALVAGCSQDKPTTIVSPSSESTGVSVSGRGEVQAPPDTGFFNVGVEVHAKTVAEARDQAAKAADAVIKSLKSNRVDEKDIKTTQLGINPEYDYKNSGQPRIVGYVVTNTVEVKVRKLDDFSKIVDDAAAAGGDNTRLQGIRFDIEDNTKLLEQARKAAMEDAKKKAEELAKLGGVKLGSPLSIAETQSTAPPPELAAMDKAFAPSTGQAPTPIQTGTGSVVVSVEVRWSIEG